MKYFVSILIVFLCFLSSCHHPGPCTSDKTIDSILPVNTNFELLTDTFSFSLDPGMDFWMDIYKGDHIAVAEFSCYTIENEDIIFIKIVNSEQKQGWITETELLEHFIPTDSISEFIHFFSSTNLKYFISIIAISIMVVLILPATKKKIPFVLLNDIDSLYPIFLCLLVSVCAVFYQSIQLFTPEDWLHYYFVPSLSPSGQPKLIAGFLLSLWLILIAVFAVVDITFKKLSTGSAFAYLLGLVCSCIFCYTFFIITTPYYIGYLCLAVFILYFLYRVVREMMFRYRCGNCGQKMKKRGECPRCGVRNE